MATQDKVLLLHKVEGTLRPRMFANLLDEAVDEIQGHLDEFEVQHIVEEDYSPGQDNLLVSYLDSKRASGRSEKTIIRYQYEIERFMNFATVKTRDITTEHVRAYLTHLQERGINESTIEGTRQLLNAYFEWLSKSKLIHINPVFSIEPIKYTKKVKETLSRANLAMLKKNCNRERDMAIIFFLESTGCRIGEVVGLDIDDVDLESGECKVLGKGNKERTVYIDDATIVMLKEYLATRNDNCKALFVGTTTHDRLKAGGYRNILKNIATKANIENVHPHRFRRTLITRLLDHGMPIQEVAILVGHDKIDTTMKYYTSSKSRIKNSYQKYNA